MNLARYIDHTNLNPAATADDIRKLCAEARKYGFASVCVNSSRVPLAASLRCSKAAPSPSAASSASRSAR